MESGKGRDGRGRGEAWLRELGRTGAQPGPGSAESGLQTLGYARFIPFWLDGNLGLISTPFLISCVAPGVILKVKETSGRVRSL